jgi:hypothetical protein
MVLCRAQALVELLSCWARRGRRSTGSPPRSSAAAPPPLPADASGAAGPEPTAMAAEPSVEGGAGSGLSEAMTSRGSGGGEEVEGRAAKRRRLSEGAEEGGEEGGSRQGDLGR